MSIALGDLILYGSAVMPDDDVVEEIGGAIDTSKKVTFADVNGQVQAVSSAGGDTVPTVEVFYRDAAGLPQSETKTLTGQTPVAYTANPMERLLKAVKSGTTTGDIAVESQTATRSNTAQSGGPAVITLDAAASAVDDFYNGQIIRLDGGTGAGQIRVILDYDGTTKIATVRAWGTEPTSSSTFRIAPGFMFDKLPAEILEIRRPFYAASAEAPGASTRNYYEKVFYKNAHATLALSLAVIKENADPSGLITFALETTINGTGTNGAGNNRQVAPSSGIGAFSSADKAVTDDALEAGDRQGTWLKLTLVDGEAAQKTSYTLELTGNTV